MVNRLLKRADGVLAPDQPAAAGFCCNCVITSLRFAGLMLP
jgi:hypothetical protein